jgi:hypothetical protein
MPTGDTIMNIEPCPTPGDSKTGNLYGISREKIISILGFKPNVKDDPYKVKNSWGFIADGVRCGIWDYKGSHEYNEWSTYGSPEVFVKLFGTHYSY